MTGPSSSGFLPDALALNTAAAVRLDTAGGRAVALQWRCLAPRRSWQPLRLSADGDRSDLFRTALRLLDGADAAACAPAAVLPLWRAGLLLTAAERALVPAGGAPEVETADAPSPPWLPPADAGARLWRRLHPGFDTFERPSCPPPAGTAAPTFAAGRWASLAGLLTSGEAAAAAGIWRQLDAAGLLRPVDGRGSRINNDPLGRALLHRLTPVVEQVVGRRLRESYAYAMAYGPGAVLPMHVDRGQCEYTLSLLLDHLPLPADGRSPWPLDVETSPGASPARFHQAPGDGLLFCGRQLPHGRPAMTEPARSLVLMLHWVDSDFPDAEMDRS